MYVWLRYYCLKPHLPPVNVWVQIVYGDLLILLHPSSKNQLKKPILGEVDHSIASTGVVDQSKPEVK